MSATAEQQKIIDTSKECKIDLLKVSACSGSGKTWTLVEYVKSKMASAGKISGLYIAYNKAIATEAASKFPNCIDCRTTHSLAYGSTVKPFKLQVGYFGYRDIKLQITYEKKLTLIDAIEEFCLSKYTSFTEFIRSNDNYKNSLSIWGEKILRQMATGDITCTHAFYLKLYHILLVNKSIVPKELDVLLLDEAGDLNEVTLEIFLNLPAKQKVMVGDPNQNIYSFNNTINGFEVLKGKGIQMGLTKSFRVDHEIATKVEAFARDTFDKDMVFHGTIHTDQSVKSHAYISRTNGQLISKMMDLNLTDTPYNLVRPVKSIFALPLVLIGLKRGGKITNPQYKFLQDDTDDYYKSRSLQRLFASPLLYVADLHSNNAGIKSAVNMIRTHGPGALIEAKDIATKYEKDRHLHVITLCTSHSSKGLEFDSVEIGDDTNALLSKLMSKERDEWSADDYEEMRLFYVAVTRARKSLSNAKLLDTYEPDDLGFDL